MAHAKQTINIKADPHSVWQALVDPAKIVVWNHDVSALLDQTSNYPTVEKIFRWKYRWGLCHLTLFEQPTMVDSLKIYASHGWMLFLKWEEKYSIEAVEDSIQLSLEMTLETRFSIFNRLLEKIYLAKLVHGQVNQSLNQLKSYCEKNIKN